MSISACAALPSPSAPTRENSNSRIAYERLAMITVVTSSCSRACVHSAWIVYIAEPSASNEITGRPGAPMAAPVAAGSPQPIPPPVGRAAPPRPPPADRPAGKIQVVVLAGPSRARLEEDRGGHRLVDHDRV